jgi:hypothetical protein
MFLILNFLGEWVVDSGQWVVGSARLVLVSGRFTVVSGPKKNSPPVGISPFLPLCLWDSLPL